MKQGRGKKMKQRGVIYFPPDLVPGILLQLPAKAFFRFKCVSKEWYDIISQPSFQEQYRNLNLLRKRDISCYAWQIFYREPRSPVTSINFSNGKENLLQENTIDYLENLGSVVASSNGLVLLKPEFAKYFVCDPLTKKYVELPHCISSIADVAIAFVCEINDCKLSMHYKVIIADASFEQYNRRHVIETYSSETGVWKVSLVRASLGFRFSPHEVAKFIKGLFYWIDSDKHTALVYDPNNIKGDLKLINLPLFTNEDGTSIWLLNQILCETTEGKLRLIRMGEELKVWVLGEEIGDEIGNISASCWVLISSISSTRVGYDITKLLRIQCVILVDDYETLIFCNGDKLTLFDCRTNRKKMVSTNNFGSWVFIQYKQPIWPLLL